MQTRHFRRFRQNGPFLAGDKARFTKNTVCATPKHERDYLAGSWSLGHLCCTFSFVFGAGIRHSPSIGFNACLTVLPRAASLTCLSDTAIVLLAWGMHQHIAFNGVSVSLACIMYFNSSHRAQRPNTFIRTKSGSLPLPAKGPKSAQKCAFAHFYALFLELAEAPLFVQIAVLGVEGNLLRVRRLFLSGPPMCSSGSRCGWDGLFEASCAVYVCLGALLAWGLVVSSFHWLKTQGNNEKHFTPISLCRISLTGETLL